MNLLELFLNDLENNLVHPKSGLHANVIWLNGHLFLQWNEEIVYFLNCAELSRLHSRFGYTHFDELGNLLQNSDLLDVTTKTRRILQIIEKSCAPCQTYAIKPRQYEFTLGDDVDFSHSVHVILFK